MPSSTMHVNPAPNDSNKSNHHWYDAVKKWRLWQLPGWKILQGIGIAAGVGYAIVTFAQWQDLRKNFMVEQRAWIYPVVTHQTNVAINEKIIVEAMYQNTGKTPAKSFSVVTKIEILDASQSPTFDYSNSILNSWAFGGLEVPNQRPFRLNTWAKRQVSGTKTTEEIAWTQDMVNEFWDSRLWIAFEGNIVFLDSFGNWHTTTFCFISQNDNHPLSTEGMLKCMAYNNTN